MLRIDLGCGTNKQPGFIGVDRYPLPGVDIITDMNGPLPFRDDSVDLLFASHSLEHVKTLLATMKEIYRICKHGAQVCVIAPYSEQKLNQANPYHTCTFNEHTPRFWTDYPSVPIDPEEYVHPQAAQWGLSTSDHSDPGIDIRLVRMEYFYFPEYAGLSRSEQRRLRRERMDVCDQIMYHLMVWKGAEESQVKSFDDHAAEFQPYAPEYIPLLRSRGREMLLQNRTTEVEGALAAIARLEGLLPSRGDSALDASQSKCVEELTADPERRKTPRELGIENHQPGALLSTALEESLDLRNHLRGAKAALVAALAELVPLTDTGTSALRDLEHTRAGEKAEPERLRSELLSLKKLQSDLRESEALLAGRLAAAREGRAAEVEISTRLRQELAGEKDEIRELRAHSARLTAEITRLHEYCAVQTEAMSRTTTELHDSAAYNRILRDEAARSARELEFARTDLRREAASAAALREETFSLIQQIRDLQATSESNDVLRAKLGLTQAELETTATLLTLQRQNEAALGGEIAASRREVVAAVQDAERWKTLWTAAKRTLGALCVESRMPPPPRLVRVGGFVVGREGPLQNLPKPFVPLRQYCDRHFPAARASLALSGDLSETPYREYEIPFTLDRLTSVSLAIRPLLPGCSGIAGIEIVSADSEILAQTHVPLTAIDPEDVTEFKLSVPLAGLKKTWLLRVFTRDADAPVPVYELARGALLRDATQFFPFVLFQ